MLAVGVGFDFPPEFAIGKGFRSLNVAQFVAQSEGLAA
jgi:hypothetical protein